MENIQENEQELMAQDVMYWIKTDVSVLYMISEMKKELKPLSKERYDYWDNIHTLVLQKMGIKRKK
jgi:hypothetical protein